MAKNSFNFKLFKEIKLAERKRSRAAKNERQKMHGTSSTSFTDTMTAVRSQHTCHLKHYNQSFLLTSSHYDYGKPTVTISSIPMSEIGRRKLRQVIINRYVCRVFVK